MSGEEHFDSLDWLGPDKKAEIIQRSPEEKADLEALLADITNGVRLSVSREYHEGMLENEGDASAYGLDRLVTFAINRMTPAHRVQTIGALIKKVQDDYWEKAGNALPHHEREEVGEIPYTLLDEGEVR